MGKHIPVFYLQCQIPAAPCSVRLSLMIWKVELTVVMDSFYHLNCLNGASAFMEHLWHLSLHEQHEVSFFCVPITRLASFYH
jgi:hypothetical protein